MPLSGMQWIYKYDFKYETMANVGSNKAQYKTSFSRAKTRMTWK